MMPPETVKNWVLKIVEALEDVADDAPRQRGGRHGHGDAQRCADIQREYYPRPVS
jgi:hypothetical protein